MTQESRIGFCFNNPDVTSNYLAPSWGLLVSPSDLRNDELFGNPLIAEADNATFTDDQLNDYARLAIRVVENELNIDILPRLVRYEDPIGENGVAISRTDIDDSRYLSRMDRKQQKELYIREPGYSYRTVNARYECRVKLRRRPVRDILTANFVDPYFGNTIIDLMPYRIVKKGLTGVCYFRPRQSTTFSNTYMTIWQRYFLNPFFSDLQDIFEIDYTTGYENCQDVPDELRYIIKKLAAVTLMATYGDGKMSAVASRSVNLNSVSESISTTMSASVDKNSIVFIRNKNTKKIKKYKIKKLYQLVKKCKIISKEYEVKSINPKNIKDIQWKQLNDVVEHIVPDKNKYLIKTKNGNIGVTEDHSLFVCENEKLIEKKGIDFKKNDNVAIFENNTVKNTKVIKINKYKAGSKVYDLSVEDFENFIVNGCFIAHNTSAAFGARMLQYEKQINEWFKQNRAKYSRTIIGTL